MSERNKAETYSESKKKFLYQYYKYLTLKARNDFFKYFKKYTKYNDSKSIIDIGSTPSLDDEQNNFLINTSNNYNITCLSDQDCKILKSKFKNLNKIIIGNGLKTNFDNEFFEISHSNATIEHVGSYKNQILFVKEMVRISKEFVFIQTPNRFYPLDFHTILPFIHWLPKNIHRRILRLLKLNFYSKEENLNLLSKNDLVNICKKLKLKKFKIYKYKLFFFTSNLILIIEK